MGQGGRALRKSRPYRALRSLWSKITTTPRSVFVRISRPNPCRRANTAFGREKFIKALGSFSWRASRSGSVGGKKGSLSITRQLRASPGISTPCQKLAVAKRAEDGSFLNSSRSRVRGLSPWRRIRTEVSSARAAQASRFR